MHHYHRWVLGHPFVFLPTPLLPFLALIRFVKTKFFLFCLFLLRRCEHRGQVRRSKTVATAVQHLQKPPTMLYCAAGPEYLSLRLFFTLSLLFA